MSSAYFSDVNMCMA